MAFEEYVRDAIVAEATGFAGPAATLTLVAVVLALVIVGLFRLLRALDSAELALRRLAADVHDTRRDVRAAGELAASVERDAARGRAALARLEDLKRRRPRR